MKYGFIGTGNMGGALATAIARGENAEVLLYDKDMEKAEALAAKISAKAVAFENAVQASDFLFIGVKPYLVKDVLAQVNDALNNNRPVIVSMAAAVTVAQLSDMISRYDIIRRAEIYRGDIALAAIPQDGVDRIAAAQAADELLTLKGVRASFVLYRSGEAVLMSARSLGEINVQVILEALGGGGNSTTAGGRVENGDIVDVRAQLTEAIDAYFEK